MMEGTFKNCFYLIYANSSLLSVMTLVDKKSYFNQISSNGNYITILLSIVPLSACNICYGKVLHLFEFLNNNVESRLLAEKCCCKVE